VAQNLSGVIHSDVLGTYHENQNVLITQKVDGKINLYRLDGNDKKTILIRELPEAESYSVHFLTSKYGYAIVTAKTSDLLLYQYDKPDADPKKIASGVTRVLPSSKYEFLGYLENGNFRSYELQYGRTYTAFTGRKISSIAWFNDEFNLAYIENGKLKMITYTGAYDKNIADAEDSFPVATSQDGPIIYYVAQNKDKGHTDLYDFDFKN